VDEVLLGVREAAGQGAETVVELVELIEEGVEGELLQRVRERLPQFLFRPRYGLCVPL